MLIDMGMRVSCGTNRAVRASCKLVGRLSDLQSASSC